MDIQTKEIYSEVYSILNMLGEQYINKLPTKLYLFIKEERLASYNPNYNEKNFDIQSVKKETISMIALLHLNYWCKSENEKSQLRKMFKVNAEKKENEKRKKYNPEDIFKNKKNDTNENAIVEYKESIFIKFINKFKKIFKF